MTINPAEAVAAIEAMEKHGLSVEYREYDKRGYVASSWNDRAIDRGPRKKTPIEAVAAWCLRNGHGWPVTVAEQQENVA